MKASWLTLCLLAVIVTALIAVNLSFNTIFASLNSARTSASLVMHRARLAALTDVPLAWRRVAPPANGLRPKALLVLLHGLNGHPVQLEHMRLRAGPAWAVYNPFVHRLGDDRLQFVLRPLKLEIARFIEAHGEAVPIVLAGVSNGARLCGELEVWLRAAATNPVMLSGIAGPFKGTKAVTLMGRMAEKMQLFGADILRELDYESPTAMRLVGAMAARTQLRRRFYFYGTRQDSMVYPVESATPHIDQDETRIVVEGYDHSSITHAVANHQFRSITLFVDECLAISK